MHQRGAAVQKGSEGQRWHQRTFWLFQVLKRFSSVFSAFFQRFFQRLRACTVANVLRGLKWAVCVVGRKPTHQNKANHRSGRTCLIGNKDPHAEFILMMLYEFLLNLLILSLLKKRQLARPYYEMKTSGLFPFRGSDNSLFLSALLLFHKCVK